MTEYYDVNGHDLCGACRVAAESSAETPTEIAPLVRAAVFGAGAAAAGAAIYYAVIAIAHIEIGYVAILIGYMVGHAVRRGARGRGGRRFQALAIALTYASVALAYTPVVVSQAIAENRNARKASATASNSSPQPTAGSRKTATPPSPGQAAAALGVLLAFIAALPLLVVFGSFPSGLISALIIFIGMKQAWTITAAPVLHIFGPYRVGASSTAAPV